MTVQTRRIGRCRRGGFALVTVLWALVVLGTLAVGFYGIARADRHAAANARSGVRARWAARGTMARAIEVLDRALAVNALAPSGDTLLSPLACEEDDVRIRATVLDARARVHLNVASASELRRLLEAVGVTPPHAAQMADAILDWRDADQVRRPGGAEAPAYGTLRPPIVPADAPFDRVEQLRSVWGMTPAVYERVATHLTVTGDGRINVNSATVAVLRTLPGVDASAAEVIAARRGRAPFHNVFDLLSAVPRPMRDGMQSRLAELTRRVAFAPREVEVVVTAGAEGAAISAELRATVLLAGGTAATVRRVAEGWSSADVELPRVAHGARPAPAGASTCVWPTLGGR